LFIDGATVFLFNQSKWRIKSHDITERHKEGE